MSTERQRETLKIFYPDVLKEDNFSLFITQVKNGEILLSNDYLDSALTWFRNEYSNGDTILETFIKLLQIVEAFPSLYQFKGFTDAALESLLEKEMSLDQRFSALYKIYKGISSESTLSNPIKKDLTSLFLKLGNSLLENLYSTEFDLSYEDRIKNHLYIRHIIDLQEVVDFDLIPSLKSASKEEVSSMAQELSKIQQQILLMILEMSLITGLTVTPDFKYYLDIDLYRKLETEFITSFSIALKRFTAIFGEGLLLPENKEVVLRLIGFVRTCVDYGNEFWEDKAKRLNKFLILSADYSNPSDLRSNFLNLAALSKEEDIQEAIKAIFTGMFRPTSEIKRDLVRAIERTVVGGQEIPLTPLNLGMDLLIIETITYHNRIVSYMPDVARLLGESISEKKEQ